jgi:hypothetical protein
MYCGCTERSKALPRGLAQGAGTSHIYSPSFLEHLIVSASDHQWNELCDEHRARQDEYTRCLRGLFGNGRIVSKERLEECERLRGAVAEARKRMDSFLEAYKARL